MEERTNEILKRFKNSWIDTKDFYNDLISGYSGWGKLKSLIRFIESLEDKGQDRHFRLGTSVARLLISRSVEHGLRTDQKYIMIDVIEFNDFEVVLRDGEKIYRTYRINDLNDIRVEKLLKTLEHTLVD